MTPRIPRDTHDEEQVSVRRKRKQVEFYGNVTSTVEALKGESKPRNVPSPTRATRSSARTATRKSSETSPAVPLPRGTRVSRRLHAVEDEWQQVPEEWLVTEQRGASSAQVNGDDESELSDLPDEGSEPDPDEGSGDVAPQDAKDSSQNPSDSALSEAPSGDTSESALSFSKGGEGSSSVGQRTDDELDGNDEEDEMKQEDEFEAMFREDVKLPEGFVEWEAVSIFYLGP